MRWPHVSASPIGQPLRGESDQSIGRLLCLLLERVESKQDAALVPFLREQDPYGCPWTFRPDLIEVTPDVTSHPETLDPDVGHRRGDFRSVLNGQTSRKSFTGRAPDSVR